MKLIEKHTMLSERTKSALRSYYIARRIQTYGQWNAGKRFVSQNKDKVLAHRLIFEMAFNDVVIKTYAILCDSPSRDGSKIRLEDMINDIKDKALSEKVSTIKATISNYSPNSNLGILRNDVIAHNIINPRVRSTSIMTMGDDLDKTIEILNLISDTLSLQQKVNLDSTNEEVSFFFNHL